MVVARLSAEARREGSGAPRLDVVPFVPGWRPTDEATCPGLGSSDQAALLRGGRGDDNRAYVLFTVDGGDDEMAVEATLSFRGPWGDERPVTLPGWHRRPVELACFSGDGDSLGGAGTDNQTFVLALEPETDLWPGGDFDPYDFDHLFLQKVNVDLRLLSGGSAVSAARATLDACDVRRLGTLYQRIADDLVRPDTARQASAAGVEDPGPCYHPWFPVLLIGSDKAALYTRALLADIIGKERYLADPVWLLRVGLYLELLTCLGIVEAVRDEVGDLLTPAEREAFETSDRYAPIRERIDPAAWRGVWALRHIAFPRRGLPRAGPVSALNLLAKKRATLRFLHVHHDDLKQAIELAGANRHSGQETWHRVFRDAERAVLRKTPEAFPELGFLPAAARSLVLWHRRGHLPVGRPLRVPDAISALMADQDGLFPAACNQYRASMNEVAVWAKERGLMNPYGHDCVPRAVSLLEAQMNAPERVAVLQRRDGYGDRLDVSEPADATQPPIGDAEALLADVSIFRMVSRPELRELAAAARPVALGPAERLIVQGSRGTSLFVVADGELEVVLRRSHGPDLRVDTIHRGEVVGEMSLLTGEPRSATVRAVDHALVYEIGRRQYEPMLRAHRDWVEELAEIMEQRLRERSGALDAYDRRARRDDIGRRLVERFFGSANDRVQTAADPAE